jgi:hypothetical protein
VHSIDVCTAYTSQPGRLPLPAERRLPVTPREHSKERETAAKDRRGGRFWHDGLPMNRLIVPELDLFEPAMEIIRWIIIMVTPAYG